jgi:hypothetical protein
MGYLNSFDIRREFRVEEILIDSAVETAVKAAA